MAVAGAVAKRLSKPLAIEHDAGSHAGVCGHTARRVLIASLTSRAARLAEHIVVIVDAVIPSRLQLHLVLVSRIDLLLRKGQEART